MDIYEALTKDHNALKPLLDQLVATSEANADTEKLLDQIYQELIPHARAEEAVFYNSLRGIEGVDKLVMHSYREHMAAETILQTLRGLNKIDVEWTTAARKLREALLHHIAEEEGKVFAGAQQVLFAEEAQQMVPAFEQIKRQALKQGDMKNTLDLVANMMPQRFAERMRSLDPAQL